MLILSNAFKKMLLICFCFLIFNLEAIAAGDTLNIKSFGAKGDGKTNDYEAFIKAIEVINKRGGNCTLVVPKGNYFIDAITTANKKYRDFEFDSCSNITIIGLSAVITLKGDYYRGPDRVSGVKRSFITSDTYSIQPFSFVNCKNVVLSGFEVNGNSDKITKDPRVAESPSHLLRIWECENVTVSNMYLHHGIKDGLAIGGQKKISKNIKVTNVIAESNARQGMTIALARDAVFEKCQFINTGYFNGKYGHHNPGAGVDIEPIRKNINGEKTGNLKFINCKFENNWGGQIRNGHANSVDSVFFIGDTIISGSSDHNFQLVLGCVYSEMQDCYINIENGNFYTTSLRQVIRQSSIINNCIIYISKGQIISTKAPSQNATVRFTNNKIYCEAQPDKDTWFNFQYGDVKFLKNEIYFPKSYFASKGKDVYIGKNKLSLNNVVKKMNN